jgi:RNA polymerase sigma-70 factor (ECF subfamily)
MDTSFARDRGVEWMLAYQAGSEAAFDLIVEAYSGQVYALFTRFLGPVPEREDLVQEVFLRVIRSRERYKAAARFSTWLYRIAFNLAVNKTQRSAPQVSLEAPGGDESRDAFEALGDPSVEDPTDALERDDVVRAVRTAIGELPETQRMALILARYEELSFVEIARVLDSSEKAIKSLVHRARENLRNKLAPFLQQEQS